MQTFLPYPNFHLSAQSLDRQRLGKQRVECKQIYNALTAGGGWAHHPAVKMWRGHEDSLLLYGSIMCEEWKRRGYEDNLMPFFEAHCHGDFRFPLWLGDPEFHRSHQSNLKRKLPEHYGPMWPDVPPDLPYVWPV